MRAVKFAASGHSESPDWPNSVLVDAESDQVLTNKLSGFYADRTLLKQMVKPEDQAEVAYLLVSG